MSSKDANPAVEFERLEGIDLIQVETFTEEGSALCLCRATFANGLIGYGQLGNKDADIAAELLHRRVVPALERYSLKQHVEQLIELQSVGALSSSAAVLVSPLMDQVLKFELNYKQMGVQLNKAIAGVDSAIWDAIGRHLGMPVYEIWRLWFFPRESYADLAPIYASSIAREASPSLLAEEFVRLYNRHGITRFKMKIGERMRGRRLNDDGMELQSIRNGIITVNDALRSLPSTAKLAFDANGAFGSAGDIVKILSSETHTSPWFIEEPVPWYRSSLQRLDGLPSSLMLAGGEQEFRPDVWGHAIAHRSFDIFQPDFGYSGGPSMVLLIALRIAFQAKGLCFAPHSPQNDLHPVFALHILTAIPKTLSKMIGMELACVDDGLKQVALEMDGTFKPRMSLRAMLQVQQGSIRFVNPSLPGWGFEVNSEWMRKCERRTSAVNSSSSNSKRSFL